MTPVKRLRRMADELAAWVAEAKQRLEATRALAAELEAAIAHDTAYEAELRERIAKSESTNPILTKSERLSRVDNTPMEDSHKLAISRGRASSRMDPQFKAAYRSKGYTLTSLAEAVDCDAPLMSKYRRKLRRVPQERAEKIAKLIPWPADMKHWPGGIVPKD